MKKRSDLLQNNLDIIEIYVRIRSCVQKYLYKHTSTKSILTPDTGFVNIQERIQPKRNNAPASIGK